VTAYDRTVQDRRDELLREMWGVVPRKVIAKKLKFSNVDNVSHAAKRLGLPSLYDLRYKEGKRDTSAATEANRERERLKKAGWRKKLRAGRVRGEEIPDLEPIDRPVCMVCHGRSATWDGHPQCRGVGRRAA
jgi:hypothetical protein